MTEPNSASPNNPRRCAVTGAGGFIASHLVEALLARGYAVRALVHYNALGRRGHLEEVVQAARTRGEAWLAENRLEIVAGDVQDARCMRELVVGCDYVFHLAALIGIPYSYAAPQAYVNTNVQGTLNVLEACRDGGVARLLHTSTSEVYGTALYTPIDEQHPIQTQSPYAASKFAGDKLAEAYYKSFNLPVVTVRPFNAFGPRQSARAVIPTVLTQLLDEQCPVLRVGAVDPVRDWTFAPDTARGFIALAEAPTEQVAGGVFNLGRGSGMTIGQMIELARQVTGSNKPLETDTARMRPAKSEVLELIADSSLALDTVGWQAEVSMEDGLRATAEWLRGHRDLYRTGEYMV